jgi:hypothetical protein
MLTSRGTGSRCGERSGPDDPFRLQKKRQVSIVPVNRYALPTAFEWRDCPECAEAGGGPCAVAEVPVLELRLSHDAAAWAGNAFPSDRGVSGSPL